MVHPQNPKRQGGIDRVLRFLAANAHHRKGRLSCLQHAPHVHRAERMFQVGAAAQLVQPKSGVLPPQYPFQQGLILPPRRPLARCRPPVAIGANFQQPRLRLAKAQHMQPQSCARQLLRPAPGARHLRSSDHRCRTHLPSPATEYFAVAKSNSSAPSSIATACGASATNCSSILVRFSRRNCTRQHRSTLEKD